MEHAEYERQMEAIKAATARIFAMAETEEEVCRLEKAINHEVMYLAAIAQSELVEDEGVAAEVYADFRQATKDLYDFAD